MRSQAPRCAASPTRFCSPEVPLFRASKARSCAGFFSIPPSILSFRCFNESCATWDIYILSFNKGVLFMIVFRSLSP